MRRARPLNFAMRSSITLRSVTPAGCARLGTHARNGWNRSRLVSYSRFNSAIGSAWSSTRRSEERILLGGVDQQRGALLAALVAAGVLACRECCQQPLRKWQSGTRLIGRGSLVDDLRPCEHVARDGKSRAGHVTAPRDASAARVGRGAAQCVDGVELARFAAVVRGRDKAHDLGRRHALRQESRARGGRTWD
jgi:hypothetical protein